MKAIMRRLLAWDAAKPAGTQKIRLSDEEIRANWAALADALGREHTFPGTMGSTAGIHAFGVGSSNPTGYEGRIAITNDLFYFYSNSAWRTLIPSGTKMLFYQSAVPTGWTQDTSVTDKMIRVVDGTGGGSGGSWTLSGVTVDGHALTVAELGHTHSLHQTTTDIRSGGAVVDAVYGPNSSSASAHTHGLTSDANWRPAYVDVVIGTKD